jgi:hypothetical protein
MSRASYASLPLEGCDGGSAPLTEPPMTAILVDNSELQTYDKLEQRMMNLLAKYVKFNNGNVYFGRKFIDRWISKDVELTWVADVCTKYMEHKFKDDVWKVRLTNLDCCCFPGEDAVVVEFP